MVPASYALSRKDLVGRNLIMAVFVFTLFFGGGLIPTYLLVRKLGLYDTIWPMVLLPAVSAWSLGPLGHNLYEDDQGRIGYVPTPAEYNGYGQFRISETAVFMTLGVVPSWAASNFLPDERNEWKNHLVDLYLPHATMYGTNAVKLSADEIAEAGVYLTDINSYIQSKEAEWVVNGRIDQEWDDYVKRLNDMGMERVLEIYQTGADRWAGE